jgi:hypothetical protein
MPRYLKCQQTAVIVDIGVFSRFQSSIKNAIQHKSPIDLSCRGNQLAIVIVEVQTTVFTGSTLTSLSMI